MNLTRLHISVALFLTALLWAGVLLLQGTDISVEHAKPFGIVVGILAFVLFVIEHFLWRVSWMHGWLFCRPDLRGTWVLELRSSYIDPATGSVIAPIICYMGISQTFSKLNMHLMTLESESWLVAHSITESPNGDGYRIYGVYTNKPKVHLRGARSEIHIGALVLDTHGIPKLRPEAITGEYFTDRMTKGSMLFSKRIKVHKTRFEDAALAFSGIS